MKCILDRVDSSFVLSYSINDEMQGTGIYLSTWRMVVARLTKTQNIYISPFMCYVDVLFTEIPDNIIPAVCFYGGGLRVEVIQLVDSAESCLDSKRLSFRQSLKTLETSDKDVSITNTPKSGTPASADGRKFMVT